MYSSQRHQSPVVKDMDVEGIRERKPLVTAIPSTAELLGSRQRNEAVFMANRVGD